MVRIHIIKTNFTVQCYVVLTWSALAFIYLYIATYYVEIKEKRFIGGCPTLYVRG